MNVAIESPSPMSEQLLVNCTPQEIRAALVQQGGVQELFIERTANRGYVGNVYMGKIMRVLPGMQSAFIDIGLERTAFLHVDDLWQAQAQRIEQVIHESGQLLVQVIKDPLGSKGARLTTRISLAGRLLVYLPYEKHIGVSQRIEDEAGRNDLRERVNAIAGNDEKGGFIVRTIAEGALDDALASDHDYLKRRWASIIEKAQTAAAPTLLYQELSLPLRLLRDTVSPQTQTIWVDSRENVEQMEHFANAYAPQVKALLCYYQGERPLFDMYDIDNEIERALARRVDLKSGGYLIFDQTEAMTTIDVNTGAFVGYRNFEETIFKTNMEAAQAIARQLRLRNLGGIIIADFIDMNHSEHKAQVVAELHKYIARDTVRMTTSDFSQLGLIEMTRKRTRESLAHVLCEICPTCQGRGEVKTARTLTYEILRDILREAKLFNAREYRVLAAPRVIHFIEEEESQALAMLSDFIGKPISLQAETGYSAEDYDIVLL